ncbi:MAG: His/Gly/Thr/Pro-type tRNA ligase C-terminal domain-containing protein [Candidatus Sungiibacteriota bacterium]
MPKIRHKTKMDAFVAGLDRMPQEERAVTDVATIADAIAKFYGFERMRLSPIESAAVWAPLARAKFLDVRRPVFCKTHAGDEVLLCVSAAIGVIRAYFSHHMQELPHPLKIMAEADTYELALKKEISRAEKRIDPAAGGGEDTPYTLRREWALVMMGEESLIAEAEIIQVLWKTCAELGLTHDGVELKINATGCNQCRAGFRTALGAFLRSRISRLCTASRRDIKSRLTNILSCDDERCRGIAETAPQVLDFLCDQCKKQLRTLLEFLDEARVPYFLDPTLFGEGSWFGEIVFVITMRQDAWQGGVALGEGESQSPDGERDRRAPVVIAEGGRVSHAAAVLGGKDLAVAAGTLFLDTIADEMQKRSGDVQIITDIFFIQLGELAKRKSLDILEALREAEMDVKESLGRDSIKIQLKIAERVGARYALVFGQKEALDSTIIVRETGSGMQETVAQEKLIDFLRKKLKK